jgi:hypothetical protein
LLEDEEIQDPHKEKAQEKGKGQADPSPKQNQDSTPTDTLGTNGDTQMQLNDQDLEDIDLEKLEEALNRKDLQTLLVEQLCKFHKVFIDSIARSTAQLGIATDPSTDSKCAPRENKRRGCKTAQQLIKEAGNLLLNLGQIQRLSKGYLHPPPHLS